jgi:hypothetical protein
MTLMNMFEFPSTYLAALRSLTRRHCVTRHHGSTRQHRTTPLCRYTQTIENLYDISYLVKMGDLVSRLNASSPACLPACLPVHLPACLPTCLAACPSLPALPSPQGHARWRPYDTFPNPDYPNTQGITLEAGIPFLYKRARPESIDVQQGLTVQTPHTAHHTLLNTRCSTHAAQHTLLLARPLTSTSAPLSSLLASCLPPSRCCPHAPLLTPHNPSQPGQCIMAMNKRQWRDLIATFKITKSFLKTRQEE